MSEGVLELCDVRKSYGTVVAVDGVDLAVADHELVALVGPSGCGKSTLLRLAAGLAPIDSGTIRIGETMVDDGVRRVEPERRRTGLVFQEHALFPHLTVADNIAFGLRNVARRNRGGWAAHWLEVIGLTGYGDRYPHELSGGERQRVALARALAPEPRLVLLDEPFASLDPNLRARLRLDIIEILRSTGTPTMLVTHDQAEALATGDRIAVMHDGRIEQVGPAEDVYHLPVNRFVAGFMGEAAFVPIAGGSTELGQVPEATGDGRLLVVRPEHVVVGGDLDGSVAATVTAAEFHGATRSYSLRLDSGTMVRATVPATQSLFVGDVTRVSLARGGPYATIPAAPS